MNKSFALVAAVTVILSAMSANAGLQIELAPSQPTIGKPFVASVAPMPAKKQYQYQWEVYLDRKKLDDGNQYSAKGNVITVYSPAKGQYTVLLKATDSTNTDIAIREIKVSQVAKAGGPEAQSSAEPLGAIEALALVGLIKNLTDNFLLRDNTRDQQIDKMLPIIEAHIKSVKSDSDVTALFDDLIKEIKTKVTNAPTLSDEVHNAWNKSLEDIKGHIQSKLQDNANPETYKDALEKLMKALLTAKSGGAETPEAEDELTPEQKLIMLMLQNRSNSQSLPVIKSSRRRCFPSLIFGY